MKMILNLLSVASVVLVALLGWVGASCNRFYASSGGGKALARINWRSGNAKLVGKWAAAGGRPGRGIIILDSIEWDFFRQTMFGLELDESRPSRSQQFVKVDHRLARSVRVNSSSNTASGLTGRFDLKGLAVDRNNGTIYAHSLDTRALFRVDPNTGALTELFVTGLANVLDLAFKMDTQEIWAVTGTQMYIIDPGTHLVREFNQTFIENNPDNRLVAVAFNPVRHVPVTLTQGEPNASPVIPPSIYTFPAKGRERFSGATNLTDVRGGTIKCNPRDVPSPDTGVSLELDPFRLTVEYSSGEVLNATELGATLEDYIFAQQKSPRVEGIKLRRYRRRPRDDRPRGPPRPCRGRTRRGWCKPRSAPKPRPRCSGQQRLRFARCPPRPPPSVIDNLPPLQDAAGSDDSVQTAVFNYKARALLSVERISESLKTRVAARYVSAVKNNGKLENAVNANEAVLVGSPPNETVTIITSFVISASSSNNVAVLEGSSPPNETAKTMAAFVSASPSSMEPPSVASTVAPTYSTFALHPSLAPTLTTSRSPSLSPTRITPTAAAPSPPPSYAPVRAPSSNPTSVEPSITPSAEFSALPTSAPSLIPSTNLPSSTPFQ